jgi:hypothetical protein
MNSMRIMGQIGKKGNKFTGKKVTGEKFAFKADQIVE